MMYTINTGGLVTVGSLLDLVDLVVYPQGPGDIVDSLSYILNGMYLSSYLASLNAREDIRDRFNDPVSVRSQLGLPMAFAPVSIQTSLQR
ncbi:hypothetical protein BDN72DRAFT_894605 [Pluteus cervinus]|uniref:Uncharacterized protein n=1 Tax=Pluteus cervinus TaxID=181527 RepID=A0ACD3B490_9AGAR|nr:hypothetical protein BDN72DRAFT_894605 [Pluteus cervinus]